MAPGDQCRIAIFQLTGKRWGWLVLTGGLAESLDRASLDVPKAAKSTDSFARVATHGAVLFTFVRSGRPGSLPLPPRCSWFRNEKSPAYFKPLILRPCLAGTKTIRKRDLV